MDIYVFFFQFLAIADIVAVNIQMCAFIFLSKYLRVDWQRLMIGSCLTFKETVFQSGYTVTHFDQQWMCLLVSHIVTNLNCNFSHSFYCVCIVFHWFLICIFSCAYFLSASLIWWNVQTSCSFFKVRLVYHLFCFTALLRYNW